MQNKVSLFKLFWIFFKISCVLFGGGYAMLPFLKIEIAEKEKICTIEDITDYYALSQCFPGLVAGNISVLIGYKARGIVGSLACIIGICLPAYLAIVFAFSFLNNIMGNPFVENIFQILDIAVCVLIFLTILELWTRSVFDKYTIFIFILSLSCTIINVSPFIIVIGAGLLSLIHFFIQKLKTEGAKNE